MVRSVFRYFAEDERFARRSRNESLPEIPLTLPFPGIFAGFPRVVLKPLSRSRSVAGVHVCVVVFCVCCVLCCAFFVVKYEEIHKYGQ